ncbi:superoxide dismutase [Pseudoalteromonas phenolica]|uniref:Superoxide dismutase n=1 Tax=Pseudoalteromonas phenolica TaxID=161398 RepID=A0A0S2K793_9GAMM|nr:superoxide dismutase [Pseudoalteromonas phenolica]ALO44236.1 Superoxide dismutase [Pseudoalteromonas phenolica]MBE0357229.1 superoxide dismutase, Fe-Mn family [Pseudoalteromonas phenolica O-BC30]RXF03576.1 superoxide dismutase [Pseudoalteromonas phenolica O-BC30]TMO56430.1 superoxide dismutase [Pseudoalteromonas phenolica]
MPFTLPKLNYQYDALEPHIDTKTMEIHHTLHHQTYVNKANEALAETEFSDKSDEWLLRNIKTLPASLQGAVRDHVGGHHNHSLFWEVMSEDGGQLQTGKLADDINKAFGSFETFKELFIKAALTRFGSGWAWLVVNEQGELQVTSSLNQDSPLMDNLIPILGLDVWEHAYYLKYQNRRPEYINAFFNVINWAEVERRYLEVI